MFRANEESEIKSKRISYQQNPAWLSYAQPIAKADADKTNSSTDEAIVNLSRKHMQVLSPVAGQPDYWVKK